MKARGFKRKMSDSWEKFIFLLRPIQQEHTSMKRVNKVNNFGELHQVKLKLNVVLEK